MPQEPQQVDLEELTRLYDNRVHNLLKFNAGMEDAFPPLRDEMLELRERVRLKSIGREEAKRMRKDLERLHTENEKLREQQASVDAMLIALKEGEVHKQLNEANTAKETLMQQMGLAKQKIHQAANRLETISETHPEIALDSDIGQLRVFLKLYEVDKNLIEEGVLRSSLESLARTMQMSFFHATEWVMEQDLVGVVSQISNMYAGIRDELVRLRPQEAAATEACHIANERQDTIWALERHLDEAKGSATELMNQTANWEHMILSGEEPTLDELRNLKQAARAFLASLAGREVVDAADPDNGIIAFLKTKEEQ